MELLPVEGHTSLGRDPESNAILNTADLQAEVAELKEIVKGLVVKEDK